MGMHRIRNLSRGEAKVIWLNVSLLVLAAVEIWLATIWR